MVGSRSVCLTFTNAEYALGTAGFSPASKPSRPVRTALRFPRVVRTGTLALKTAGVKIETPWLDDAGCQRWVEKRALSLSLPCCARSIVEAFRLIPVRSEL